MAVVSFTVKSRYRKIMQESISRIIFLSVWLAIGIAFNYRVYKTPNFVDKPLDGWWGQMTNSKPEDKEKRLEAYRRMAKRNFFCNWTCLYFSDQRHHHLDPNGALNLVFPDG